MESATSTRRPSCAGRRLGKKKARQFLSCGYEGPRAHYVGHHLRVPYTELLQIGTSRVNLSGETFFKELRTCHESVPRLFHLPYFPPPPISLHIRRGPLPFVHYQPKRRSHSTQSLSSSPSGVTAAETSGAGDNLILFSTTYTLAAKAACRQKRFIRHL
jgi:hypothetical protein